MSYQVLARKWRPRSFADMVGQGHVVKALANALDSNRLHHAYLFSGTRGVGKTTVARILAKCLNCESGVGSRPCGQCSSCIAIDEGRFVDLIEVDAASRAKVDETRDLMDNVQYSPSVGRYKVYLIDEVHMFSNHSFNALLKTLEEPPPHVKFLLATTEPKKLPVTILSRCLQFNLKHLGTEQISGQLERIVEKEGIEAEPASIHRIAAAAGGSMRDALSLLDQAVAYGNGALREDLVREMLGTIDSQELAGLLQALAAGDAGDLFARIDRIAEHNPDYDAILAELLTRLHDAAVGQLLDGGAGIVGDDARSLAESVEPEDIQLYYQIALQGRRDLAAAPDSRVGFEMTLVRMLAFRPMDDTAESSPGRAHGPPEARKVSGAPAAVSNAAATEAGSGAAWKKIIDEMALAGLVRELAGHCVLKEHTPEKVHLVLAPEQEHLLKTTQKEKLQDAIRTRFGADVKLVITVEDAGGETPAAQREREARERQQEAIRSMQEDPNVKAMAEIFDATLDPESIHPQQH